jgi:predicted negative regulator of RcsB-dependent stress response
MAFRKIDRETIKLMSIYCDNWITKSMGKILNPPYSPFIKGGWGDFYTKFKRIIFLCILICITFFAIGCAPSWNGKIVYLENGKLVIQPESDSKIKNGQKLLIYRQKTITHPVTKEEFGTIKDNIAEVSVLWVNNKTVTAFSKEPWFDMMMVDDNATAIRGTERLWSGSVIEIGRIKSIDESSKTVEVSIIPDKAIFPGETLTVVKYTDAITNPESDDIIAIAVESVAILNQNKDNKFTYDLIDKTLGWIEVDDFVVKRTGDMQKESRWFQDPPESFSKEMIFQRNYLRAIDNFNNNLYKETMLELEVVNKANPNYKDVGYLTGLCYAKLNRYDEAIKYFNEYLKQNQDDARAWTELAYIYLNQNKLSESAEAYEKLANLMPAEPTIWVDMGDIYRQLGNQQKAKQAYMKALEIDPNNEEAKYELQT